MGTLAFQGVAPAPIIIIAALLIPTRDEVAQALGWNDRAGADLAGFYAALADQLIELRPLNTDCVARFGYRECQLRGFVATLAGRVRPSAPVHCGYVRLHE